MRDFTGKGLFPEAQQVDRIRKTAQSILDEVASKLCRKISYAKFCDVINEALTDAGYPDSAHFNTSLINRLVRFGSESTGANSLKLLESFPLLYVVSEQYSVSDLQRIALGQTTPSDETVIVEAEELREVKQVLLKAMARLEAMERKSSEVMLYDPSISPDQKFALFCSILNYADNLEYVFDNHVLTAEQIEQYNKTENVEDEVVIFLLANCKIPPNVALFFSRQKQMRHLS